MTASSPAPFVGRTEELLALADALDAATAGQCVPVLVGGEAGVGKTRLVSHFVARLPSPIVAHWGRCIDDGGAPPFWPWTQLLRSLTGTSRGVKRSIEDDRFAGFASVAAVLRDQTVQPTVLVLDDLHVADIGSLELMRFLVRAVADVPVMLIGTHRDHELRADAERDVLLGDVARIGRRLVPPRLDRDEVSELLAGIAGEAVASSVVDAVLDRTAGNALFVDELARVMASNGFTSVEGMPDGVRAIVRARLHGVPTSCREALTAASVLGVQIDWSVLAALLEVSPSELSDRLGPAIANGMISTTDSRLEFSHSLVRDAICEDLTPSEQATWHHRAADTLLDTYRDRPDFHAAAIAQHYANAELVAGAEPAARWASQAAAVARAVHGHEEAAAWSDRAAGLYARLGHSRAQAEELALAADDLGSVGHNDASSERAKKVTALARSTGSGELLARAARCRAEVFGPARDHRAPALLREALDHPDNSAPTRRRAELLASLATRLGVAGLDGRVPDAEGARAAHRELGRLVEGGVEARDLFLQALLSTEHGPESFAERPAWFREYDQLVRSPTEPLQSRMRRTYWEASLAFESGRLGALRRVLDDWAHISEILGVRYWEWRLAASRACEAHAHGRLVEAEERAMASIALARDLYPELTVRIVVSIVITVRHEQGRTAELTERWPVEGWGAAATLLHIATGDTAQVARLVAEQRAEAERSERSTYWLCLMSYLTRGAVHIEDRDTCRWVVDQLTPFADQFVMFGRCSLFGGPVAELIGVAAAAAGDLPLAERHLRTALDWAEREDAAAFATRFRLGLALALGDAGPTRRPEREMLLRNVVESGSRLGLAGVVAEAERNLDGQAYPLSLDHQAADQPHGPAIRTFGEFSVSAAGVDEPVRWASKKARDTLKYLVTRRGAAVSREVLIDMLWPDIDPARGRSRLSVVLTMVRSALDPDRRWSTDHFLRADRDVVALRTERLDIDLDRFFDLAKRGLERLQADDPRATGILEQALALAHGDFLVEDSYADWPATTRADLATTVSSVLHALADQARRAGDRNTLVRRLSQLVDRHPYDEEAHRTLVAALTDMGRHADAKRQEAIHAARMARLHLTEPV